MLLENRVYSLIQLASYFSKSAILFNASGECPRVRVRVHSRRTSASASVSATRANKISGTRALGLLALALAPALAARVRVPESPSLPPRRPSSALPATPAHSPPARQRHASLLARRSRVNPRPSRMPRRWPTSSRQWDIPWRPAER